VRRVIEESLRRQPGKPIPPLTALLDVRSHPPVISGLATVHPGWQHNRELPHEGWTLDIWMSEVLARPYRHDWIITITDPAGRAIGLLGSGRGKRFQPVMAEPALGDRYLVFSLDDNREAEHERATRWTQLRTLHASALAAGTPPPAEPRAGQ